MVTQGKSHRSFLLIRSMIQACSLADESTYNLASSTLYLLARLLDLSTTNKALAVEWVDRDLHARLILDLFVSLQPDAGHGSSTKDRLIVQICDLLATLGNKTLDAGVTSRVSPIVSSLQTSHSLIAIARSCIRCLNTTTWTFSGWPTAFAVKSWLGRLQILFWKWRPL